MAKKNNAESFEIIVTQDQAEEFAKHIKKYGAFSKMTLSEQGAVFPKVVNGHTEFSSTETDISEWQKQAIMTGQAWIAQATEHEFQPQNYVYINAKASITIKAVT